ncbi:MAG: hypothetical protein Q7R73_04485 [bacterium]|nr:hypothetical protein [bacterium]
MKAKNLKNLNSGAIDVDKYAISEPLNFISLYEIFCVNDIEPALKELKRIKDDKNRVHLQKLVYTNLVNRFDALVDNLILWFSINNEDLRNAVLKDVKEEPIYKKEVFELFIMKERAFEFVNEKIKTIASGSLLRERHSKKIQKIFSTALKWPEANFQRPRVHEDGTIFYKRSKNKTQPNTIVGYADWLYSRRNSIVHGDGMHYNELDFSYITKTFQVSLSKNFRLQLSSVTSASKFYKDLLKLIRESLLELIKSPDAI